MFVQEKFLAQTPFKTTEIKFRACVSDSNTKLRKKFYSKNIKNYAETYIVSLPMDKQQFDVVFVKNNHILFVS